VVTFRGSQETQLRLGVYILFSSAEVVFRVRVAVFVCVVEKQLVQKRHTLVHVTAVPVEIRTLLL